MCLVTDEMVHFGGRWKDVKHLVLLLPPSLKIYQFTCHQENGLLDRRRVSVSQQTNKQIENIFPAYCAEHYGRNKREEIDALEDFVAWLERQDKHAG